MTTSRTGLENVAGAAAPHLRRLARVFSLRVLLMALVLWLPLLVLLHSTGMSAATLNVVTLTGLMMGCLGVAASRVAVAPYTLWFPIPWFLLSSATYYGLGPLLYYFGTAETVNQADAFYLVNDALLLRCNILTVSGIVVVLLIYLALSAAFDVKPAAGMADRHSSPLVEVTSLWRAAIVFAVIGVMVKVFLVIPTALGLWELVLPGSIEYFGQFSSLALVPLFILATTVRRRHFALFAALLCFELVTAFIQLSKLAIMKIALLLALAMVLRGTSVRKVALMGVFSVFFYAQILVPLVGYGRIAFDVLGVKTASEAAALLQEFAGGTAQDTLASMMPGVQSWWGRLNYATAQGFAVDSYDEGLAGDTFELAAWVLVPRILYPDKPVTTTGDKFNELIAGNPHSKSAPGMFAEGYWNAGWVGLIMVSVVMGICYWGWERYTRARLMPRLQVEYLPVAWMGLFIAIQQDSWFVPGTLGMIPFAILFHVLARVFLSTALLRGSTSGRAVPSKRRKAIQLQSLGRGETSSS